MDRKQYKLEWQRKKRKEFKEQHGYSQTRFYDNEGLREEVLRRDGYKCIECGMTVEEHLKKWGRPITVHHKNRNHKDNQLDNMETLCLSCHGRKDISQGLIQQQIPKHKHEILVLRALGFSYDDIADYFGFSTTGIWKWTKRWKEDLDKYVRRIASLQSKSSCNA